MSADRNRVLRGSVRATTGVLITAVTATAVVLLAGVTLPEVSREPVSVAVDTAQTTQRTVVCAGSFAELGVDPENPEATTMTGDATVVSVGAAETPDPLTRDSDGSGSLPEVRTGQADEPFAAAQVQQVETEKIRGTAASTCAEPANEQWLVGGDTLTGTSATLSVANPGDVSATVQVHLYDENGPVDSGQTAGVLVPPKSERTVSLNGYAPGRELVAARVVSTGATVTASMGVGQTVDIRPFAADTVTRQLDPQTHLVIPGVANETDHDHTHGTDAENVDEFSVLVRALAPGDSGGTATVRAVDENGKSTDLGKIDLEPGVVGQLEVQHWPEQARAVIVDSDVPIVGGAMGSAQEKELHDNAWFAPAPELPDDETVAAPIVSGGRLVLVNPADTDATVRIEKPDADEKDKPREVEVPAGAAVTVKASARSMLSTEDGVHASVQVLDGPEIAGYPILPLGDRVSALTVYTR